ncbi:head GIN domain-containing protein [Allomuricauda sp. d1]|uniref:head GIN domain-containing protein n=1 Tax=Allomuricauda sp. d1 TaxID=3136725 RepID=UPI0031DBFC4D
MRHLLSFGIFCLIFCAVGAQEERITQNLADFNEIKAFDGLSINLIKSDENKAVITGANTRKVAIVNNSGVLKLRMEIDKIFSGYRTFIDVHYTEKINVVDVNEDARITSEKPFVQDVLELKAQEGGEIQLSCQTEQLLIKAVSGGEIATTGSSDNQDVIINTGGSYDGKLLKTEFTTVTVNAGGEASIYATDYVKANVKAGGKVFVYGNPKKMDEKTVFGGKIERIE